MNFPFHYAERSDTFREVLNLQKSEFPGKYSNLSQLMMINEKLNHSITFWWFNSKAIMATT